MPEDEVREIIRKYYDATGTHEESMQAVMDYIRQKEPEWKMKYFYNNADNVSGNAFNGTSTISASSPMTPNWQGRQRVLAGVDQSVNRPQCKRCRQKHSSQEYRRRSE